MKKVTSIKAELAVCLNVPESSINAQIHNIEHHRSHLASAFFASSYEEAAILSIDGFGDFSSTMKAFYHHGVLFFRFSLGIMALG
jgi:carbamoyltransferase